MSEIIKVATTLQAKQYYLDLYKENYIDKNKIYSLTKKINDLLHFKFGIKNLYHRMIFTASALVVERFGGLLYPTCTILYQSKCHCVKTQKADVIQC